MTEKHKKYSWAKAIYDLAHDQSGTLSDVVKSSGLNALAGDLSEIDLSNTDLSGQDLSGWDLSYANMTDANLRGSKLRGAKITAFNLIRAKEWQAADLDDDLRLEAFALIEAEGKLNIAENTMIAPILILMGVSGCGKTTILSLLADALNWHRQEGDSLHPPANIEKMRAGTPLTDLDRGPWLKKIAEVIDHWREKHVSGVVTCSALKRSYRDIIIGNRPRMHLVYLKGAIDLIRPRLAARLDHYMPADLLHSQFATLEEPTPDELPIVIDIGGEPTDIAIEIVRQLGGRQTIDERVVSLATDWLLEKAAVNQSAFADADKHC